MGLGVENNQQIGGTLCLSLVREGSEGLYEGLYGKVHNSMYSGAEMESTSGSCPHDVTGHTYADTCIGHASALYVSLRTISRY